MKADTSRLRVALVVSPDYLELARASRETCHSRAAASGSSA
jgi:hypothetical protein